jgi:hypothetical protein
MGSNDSYNCVNSFWYYCNSILKIKNSESYVHRPKLNKNLYIVIFNVEDLIKETIKIQKLPGDTEDKFMKPQDLETNVKCSQNQRKELNSTDILDVTVKINGNRIVSSELKKDNNSQKYALPTGHKYIMIY